jgi:hypothetical protein
MGFCTEQEVARFFELLPGMGANRGRIRNYSLLASAGRAFDNRI